MPGKHCKKHTPITSKAQQGFMGAKLARKRADKKDKVEMSQAELSRHLKESKGKDLPSRSDVSKYVKRHGKK